ncbi:MAG TPA: response regulator [Anaeromyxobacter sp.]
MPVVEYACVFVRPPRERLSAAAQLVGAVPAYMAGAEGELDLHHCVASGYTAAVVRAAPEAFTPEALARLGFWFARAGARTFLVDPLPEDEKVRFQAELALCERALRRIGLREAPEMAARFFRAIGVAPPEKSGGARPLLAVDLDGPGAEGIAYRPDSRSLFVAGTLAPPCGDQLALSVRHDSASGPVDGWATVVEVRRREEAGPGRPAGFTLRIEGPTPLHELLAQRAQAQPGREVRAAPRYPVKAPVKVTPAAAARAEPEPPRPVRTPPPRARVEYTSDQELAADWIENLSHGGAFVRTSSPHPEGTELAFELSLPDGARLDAKAVVAFVNAKGMGLRFVLSPEQDQVLSAAIARISARPRRALVVDDDALARRMISDALVARGFEVLTAEDGRSGIHTLMEEILALDLLVTDVVMPGLGGEALIRTIRQAGGEAELAIVAVSSFLEPGAERTLEAAGADAVLDKALGADLVAQAADAALERKRLVQRADAA